MQNSTLLPHSATSSIKAFDRAGEASPPSSPNPRRLNQHLQTMVPLHARRRLNGYGTNDYFLGDAYVRNQDDRSTSPMSDSLDATNYALHIKSATDF